MLRARGGKSPNPVLYSLILLKISLFYSQGRIAPNRWYVVRVTMARERTNPVEEGLTEEINITRASIDKRIRFCYDKNR